MIENLDHNEEARELFAKALEKENRQRKFPPHELLDIYDQVIKLEPEFGPAYFCRGKKYLDTNRPEKALEDINRALELGHKDAETYYTRVKCYALIGNKREEAMQDLRTVLELNPRHVLANDDMGYILFEEDKKRLAYKYFTAAIHCNTNNPVTFFRRALINIEEKRYEHAIVDLLDSRTCNPSNAETHFVLGNCYYELGVFDRALKSYEAATVLKPLVPDPYYKMGCVYYDQGDFDNSIKHFTTLINFLPDSETGYFSRALAHLGKEDFGSAIADLKRAIEINSEDASAHYLLSQAYLGKGDEALGKKYYDKALALGYLPEEN
ncbi:MAG: tetratricopeptide repeat protein [Clostridiales bacterium]|nr:tetratricopeptide repeat protein [Clostridiales bacterium]